MQPEEQGEEMRQERDDHPDHQQARPGLAQPGYECRAGGQPHDADEDRKADGVENPEGRLGDSAERRVHRTQPAEDEPMISAPPLVVSVSGSPP